MIAINESDLSLRWSLVKGTLIGGLLGQLRLRLSQILTKVEVKVEPELGKSVPIVTWCCSQRSWYSRQEMLSAL